jgi:hypothetical protein
MLKVFVITSLVWLVSFPGCRQIFGDGDPPELIVQVPVEADGIQILTPVHGSIWKPGDVIKIKWINHSIKKIDIHLYRKTAFQFIISENLTNTGSFDWEIPTDIQLSNHYMIKIINHNNTATYQFSGRFGIQ